MGALLTLAKIAINISHAGREVSMPEVNQSNAYAMATEDVIEGDFRVVPPEPECLPPPRDEPLPKATWIPE